MPCLLCSVQATDKSEDYAQAEQVVPGCAGEARNPAGCTGKLTPQTLLWPFTADSIPSASDMDTEQHTVDSIPSTNHMDIEQHNVDSIPSASDMDIEHCPFYSLPRHRYWV